jgi:hypothetical protein
MSGLLASCPLKDFCCPLAFVMGYFKITRGAASIPTFNCVNCSMNYVLTAVFAYWTRLGIILPHFQMLFAMLVRGVRVPSLVTLVQVRWVIWSAIYVRRHSQSFARSHDRRLMSIFTVVNLGLSASAGWTPFLRHVSDK